MFHVEHTGEMQGKTGMTAESGRHGLQLEGVVDQLEIGVFAVDADMRVVLWNRYMAMHSGQAADSVVGRNLFERFPELPAKWLEKKIRNVFALRNYAFTSWEQRPFLFRFRHNRPVTGGVDAMRQSCIFQPMADTAGEVAHVCINLFDHTDVAIYQQRLHSAITELEREKEEQRRLIARLDAMVAIDGLTGIANRRRFDEMLEREWLCAVREHTPLSLIMLDVDFFKLYNDAYGHQQGDDCLKAVAQAVAAAVLRHGDLAARYGGEEFALILPHTPLEGARCVAERILENIRDLKLEHRASKVAPNVTASLGVSCDIPDRGQEQGAAGLLLLADQALYAAKQQGRARVVCAV